MKKELEKYNEVQKSYLVAKAKLMVLEEEMVQFHKDFTANWSNKDWDDPKKFDKLLGAEEVKEKELGLYEIESKFFQAEKELKNWFMEEIKDDSRIPAKTKKELHSNKDISSPKIQNKIKELALQWEVS
jgi:hypothetical protein